MTTTETSITTLVKNAIRLIGLSVLIGTTTLPGATFGAIRILGADSNKQITIAAMILTFDEHSAIGERMFDTFQKLGATIDLVVAPNNAQTRAAILDFRSKTRSADVALVFVEGGLLMRGDAVFLVPQGVEIRRENDLLTRAIPLSALVRGVSTAAVGGVVFALDHDVKVGPDVRHYAGQELTGRGTGTLVAIQQGFDVALVVALEKFLEKPTIDLKEIVEFVDDLSGINASEMRLSILLRREIVKEPENPPAAGALVGSALKRQETAGSSGLVIDAGEPTEDSNPLAGKVFTMAELKNYQATFSKDDLKAIQSSLKNFNHYRGWIDGIMGKGTTRAIRHFQEARREDVTGFLTPQQHADLLK